MKSSDSLVVPVLLDGSCLSLRPVSQLPPGSYIFDGDYAIQMESEV